MGSAQTDLFVTAGVRLDHIQRDAIAGDADRVRSTAAAASDSVVSANPENLGRLVRSPATDGNFTKLRASAPAPASGRRTLSRSRSRTIRR